MNLQQMEYIVAVDKYRHFVRASEACGITQSTLSSMIQKLETELNVLIFDRNSHPIKPTETGEKVIAQAKVILFNSLQMKEIVLSEQQQEAGILKLGVIPTIAPYIIPKLFKDIHEHHPNVSLSVMEALTATLIQKLKMAEIDVALLVTPLHESELLEIPVYYEKFVVYVSPDETLFTQKEIESHQMPSEHLWVLQEGNCLRNQVMNLCVQKSNYSAIYEAGSIETLVKIVDENSGYTIIPELHVELLRRCQQRQIRKLVNPEPVREVSLVVRNDYVRERLLNVLVDTIKKIIPEHMLDARLKKFAIRL